jgi:Zn finger protein HypA/HybF involved in hydrogenase expression
MGKTKIECRKCGKICEVETHELRDVIDAVCPKCSSEHIFIRDIHLDA